MENSEIMTLYDTNPKAGFEEMYSKFAGKLLYFARNTFGLNVNDAEDVVHDALLPWVEKPQTLKDVKNLSSYLFTSVRNGILKRKTTAIQPVENTEQEAPTNFQGNIDASIAVEEALKKLPEVQRETVVLRVWGDLSLDEIADIQSVPLQTVSSRYRYGLQKMRELLEWMK